MDDDSDAGEEGDEDRCCEESPNKTDLDLVSHDSEEEEADRELAYTNDHETGHLTEDFEFDGGPVDIRIADLREQSSETIAGCHSHKGSVEDLKNL